MGISRDKKSEWNKKTLGQFKIKKKLNDKKIKKNARTIENETKMLND